MDTNVATTTPVDPIAAAIAAATAAAQAHLANQAQAVAPVSQTSTAVVTPGRPLGYDDLATGSISVDQWLSVKEHGLILTTERLLVGGDILVDINLSAVAHCRAIKFGSNPVTYLKSYDGATCATGGSWQGAIERAQRVDPKARDYPSADIPMTVVKAVMDVSGKKELAAAGSTLGHTLATTNWAHWKSFMEGCRAAGVSGVVRVQLGVERKSKNGNNWGLITFTRVAAA